MAFDVMTAALQQPDLAIRTPRSGTKPEVGRYAIRAQRIAVGKFRVAAVPPPNIWRGSEDRAE
jgi:hypothetical protein